MQSLSKGEELAWAAGFFDGEGSAGCYKRGSGNGLRLVASVWQKQRDPLDRFLRIVGCGNVYKVRTRGHYQWQGTSEKTFYAVMMKLWPYLCEQKRQQFVVAFLKYADRAGRRKKCRFV